jgi:hypothetical protein
MNTSAHARALLLFTLLVAHQAPGAEPRPAATLQGRIFFTAAERHALEAGPKTPPAPVSLPPPPPPPPPAPPPAPIRFDGALWREGRVVTLWLDGNATRPTAKPAIRISNGVPSASMAGRREDLLPGQSWSPQESGAQP